MYFSYNEAISWVKEYKLALEACVNESKHTIVLCPSFEVLGIIANQIDMKTELIQLGAQDCSMFAQGAYTGQVSARSLKEIGCAYCVVGHSEIRQWYSLSDQMIAKKVHQLLLQGIMPIICIGESKEHKRSGDTLIVLERQLKLTLHTIYETNSKNNVLIAYEPIWAVGTDKTPDSDYLVMVFDHIASLLRDANISEDRVQFIYGGGVDYSIFQEFSHIPLLNGFLIGRASTNFQILKKIVS